MPVGAGIERWWPQADRPPRAAPVGLRIGAFGTRSGMVWLMPRRRHLAAMTAAPGAFHWPGDHLMGLADPGLL